jgi:AraC-like DNA-binding protein
VLETRVVFSDEASCPLGRVRLAGTLASSAGVKSRRFPSYAMVYLIAGSGRFSDELGADRNVGSGDLMVVFPGVQHSYGPVSGRDWHELYVVFDGPVFELWEECGLLDRRRPVHRLDPVDFWLRELRAFIDRHRPRSARDRQQQVCRFLVLISSMLAGSEQPATWLERAQALLSSDLGARTDLPGVAAELGLGYEAFRKRFRRETGMGPWGYRNIRRMEVAAELLTSTSMSHREIATSLGFNDEFHFSRRFKQWAGTAPRDVRRRAAEARLDPVESSPGGRGVATATDS